MYQGTSHLAWYDLTKLSKTSGLHRMYTEELKDAKTCRGYLFQAAVRQSSIHYPLQATYGSNIKILNDRITYQRKKNFSLIKKTGANSSDLTLQKCQYNFLVKPTYILSNLFWTNQTRVNNITTKRNMCRYNPGAPGPRNCRCLQSYKSLYISWSSWIQHANLQQNKYSWVAGRSKLST